MKPQFRIGVIILVTLVASVLVAPFAAQDGVDLRNLPLGDGNVSTEPQVGFVFSCQTEFNANIGGAFREGEWINTANGTYDRLAKTVAVDGEVMWPAEFEITLSGATRIVTSNGYPSHPTGNYPVASNDDAYNYDRNPNSIQEQDVLLELPANPEFAAESTCLNMGTIGIMLTGGVFFNALDGPGRDAVAHEILDNCDGHPESTGEYHYHDLSLCIEAESSGEHSALVGYALDGFGIYGRYGDDGVTLTNADLDECHGHTSEIEWDGEMVSMYHYHATWEYPYTVGCFRGTPIASPSNFTGAGGQQQGGNGGQQPGGNGGQQPPPPPGGGNGGGQQPPPPGGGRSGG